MDVEQLGSLNFANLVTCGHSFCFFVVSLLLAKVFCVIFFVVYIAVFFSLSASLRTLITGLGLNQAVLSEKIL